MSVSAEHIVAPSGSAGTFAPMGNESTRRIVVHVATGRPDASNDGTGEAFANDATAYLGQVLERVAEADAVIFDGRAARDFAVGAELMFAKLRGQPVVALCPDDSPYRSAVDHSPHPMLLGICDHIARSMAEATAWADAAGRSGRSRALIVPDGAIAYARATSQAA